jgi:hypothetical protein
MTMTSPHIPDADPAAAVARLRERFAVPIWFGKFTRRYWAILGGQLVDATDAAELGRILEGVYPPQLRRPPEVPGR